MCLKKAEVPPTEKENSIAVFRHKLIYRATRLVIPFILRKYGFKTDVLPKTEGNYIVLSNHLTEVDMLMAEAAFPQHMYIVAGEHLIRSKYGKLIAWSQDPILRPKGASSTKSVKEIIRRIKEGHNVLLFPEGSRSFDGETKTLPESVAKLVKRCGCGLVTYHIEGGYFVAPRWAYTSRVGPMKGEIVRVRSSEELAAMSTGELTEAINHELYEHAYETQRKKRLVYRGKRLAEGLENYLVKCPRCGSFDSLSSEKDGFSCNVCGLSGVYTQEGFLQGNDLKFDNVYDWGHWAERETEKYIRSADMQAPVFRDTHVTLYEVTDDHKRTDLYSGEIVGYHDCIRVGEERFAFENISAIDMLYYGKTLLFTCGKRYLGITGERFHAIKYYKLYEQRRREVCT